MMKLNKLILLAILTLSTQLWALEFEFAGYVGNSGTKDKPVLVGVDPKEPHWDYARHVTKHGNPYRDICIGPVYDNKTGLIYATAGYGTINAYSLDGRVIKSYTLPKGFSLKQWKRPRMNRTGSFLVIRTGHSKQLYKIPLNAPDGTAATIVDSLVTDMQGLSVSSRNGKCLILKKGGDIFTYDPQNDALEKLCNIGKMNIAYLDWTPDGNIFLEEIPGKVRFVKFKNGKAEIVKTSSSIKGQGFTITGKHLWSCEGGTVYRYAFPSMAPDPGVVFGGASGSFLGYVVMNREMDASFGITKIRENLFAIASGNSQIIHLAEWNDVTKKLVMVRRIGAIPWINTLLVDDAGNVFINRFVWKWGDDSLSPLCDSFRDYIYESANLGNDLILHFGLGYDYTKRCSVFKTNAAPLSRCGKSKGSWLPSFKILLNTVGAAAYKIGKKQYVLLLDASGKASVAPVNNDGAINKGSQKDISLRLKKAGKEFSDLAGIDDSRALVAVDGELVEVKLTNSSCDEKGRWKTKFSPGCKIAVNGDRVFVTEKDKNLLSVYSLKNKSLLGKLSIDTPTHVSANGKRLVVYEEKNQRVSKYNLISRKGKNKK